MRRFLSSILVCGGFVFPLMAADGPDCSKWTMEGFGLGMPLAQANEVRNFDEFEKLRHPSLDYRRYVWQSEDGTEKVELHVDMQAEPPTVMGVSVSIPTSVSDPRAYFTSTVERWGKPDAMSRQGAFNLYTWNDSECDVTARMSVMNHPDKVGIWAALTTFKALDEIVRRKRTAFPEDAASDDEGASEPASGDAKDDDD